VGAANVAPLEKIMSTEIQVFNPNASFTQEQEAMLKEPLKAERIHYRKGPNGIQLKYITGDDAIGVANDIFGYGKWGYRVINREHKVIEDRSKGPMDVYICDIELFVTGAMFPFSGDGMAAVNQPYTVEMHDMARHAAETDAVKRALRYYGDQFGLSLYDKDDYVDIGDGVLERVGNVHEDKNKKGNQQNNGRRVVDDQPPDPTIKAASTALYNAALQAKNRSKKLGITDDEKWLALLDLLQIKEFTNGADIAKMNGKLTEIEKKSKASS
jgi:DNA repair and recombination protein RAD52